MANRRYSSALRTGALAAEFWPKHGSAVRHKHANTSAQKRQPENVIIRLSDGIEEIER